MDANESEDNEEQNKCCRSNIVFNIFCGQLIAMCLVAGGVFTQNLQNQFKLQIPTLQLTFMYIPLTFYLVVWIRDRRRRSDSDDDED